MQPPTQPQQWPPQQPYAQQPPPQQWGPPALPPRPPAKKGRSPWLILAAVIGGVVLLGALIQATGGPDKSEPTANRSSAKPTDQAKITTKTPKPDAQQTEDLLYGLRQIDKELDRARSIDRARNSCSDLLQGMERSKVIERTRLRFDGVADIDTADARAIVKLIEQGGWCRA